MVLPISYTGPSLVPMLPRPSGYQIENSPGHDRFMLSGRQSGESTWSPGLAWSPVFIDGQTATGPEVSADLRLAATWGPEFDRRKVTDRSNDLIGRRGSGNV